MSKAVDEPAEEVTDRAESEHDEGDLTDDSPSPCCNGHGLHGFYRRVLSTNWFLMERSLDLSYDIL